MGGAKVIFSVIFLIGTSSGARQLRGDTSRGQRSLVNSFPFNSNSDDHHHAHHEEHEAEILQSLDSRTARQGADGKKCIDKVEMVEETEYDDVVQCDHSYDKRCH